MRQNHTVNIIFPGNMEELESYLQSKGVEFEFIPPGLVNSESVMIIDLNEGVKDDSRSTNSVSTEV